jgi:hypothetical protein
MSSSQPIKAYRGEYGAQRPAGLANLGLPPARLPLIKGGRPRKQWRYVAIHSQKAQICAATAAAGPFKQSFWAVWDRESKTLHERTVLNHRRVETPEGRLLVRDGDVEIEFELEESAGVETVSPAGRSWIWTRKQGGIPARGRVRIGERELEIEAPAMIDDSAGFHDRRTDWLWSSGVGVDASGRNVAWNLVNGLHDGQQASERTVWIDGVASQLDPCRIASDLTSVNVGESSRLYFHEEAVRSRHENLLLMKSDYSQPFGTFTGNLAECGELISGLGVMERHAALW